MCMWVLERTNPAKASESHSHPLCRDSRNTWADQTSSPVPTPSPAAWTTPCRQSRRGPIRLRRTRLCSGPPPGPLSGRVSPEGEVSMMDVWLVALPQGLLLRHLSALWIKRPFVSSESSAVAPACNFTAVRERGRPLQRRLSGEPSEPGHAWGTLSFPSIFLCPTLLLLLLLSSASPLSHRTQPTLKT